MLSTGTALGGLPVSGPAAQPGTQATTAGPGEGTGLTGSYFNNGSLAGTPLLRRVDAVVDFEWKTGIPAPGLRSDNFSVRWEGQIEAPATGRYKFITKSDDGVRLWVNGKQILDNWNGQGSTTTSTSAEVSLAAGERATIKVEYYDQDGDANVRLQWVRPGQGAQTVPSVYLYPLEGPGMPVAEKATIITAVAPEPEKPAKPAKATAAKPAAPATSKAAPAAKAPATTAAKAAAPKPVAAAKPAPAPKPAKQAAPTAAEISKALNIPGVFTLMARSDGKPLEVAGDAPVSKDPGLTSAPAGAPQWEIEEAGSGYYKLTVQGGRKVLEVLGSETSNGAPLSLWPYYSGNNQLWKIEDVGEGYYKLTAKHSNKALTAGTEEEGGLQQRRYGSRPTQQWKLEAAAPKEAAMAGPVANVPVTGSNRLAVYPNPSSGMVQMAYQLGDAQPIGWVLYDQRGSAVRVSDYRRQQAGPHHQTLDFTGLPSGDYNLNLTVGGVTTRQLVSIRRPGAATAEPEPGAEASK
ncbi:Por secretion system C-terminal sorting domain-containing protein [Hymenobacter psychrotolerans DSM 18569]|uniref:Por secretion system C-terminal sorting domain-containing protein n=1 Tax=Hymenobacter psychrotolerans DSM 18569 TaxID=1121959 RepID=A0A1M7AA32_9BACT|nr:Por secretion system C-terminal sorting domain-containing protein [Hymenobacter psychrotolerans DSM 18569]